MNTVMEHPIMWEILEIRSYRQPSQMGQAFDLQHHLLSRLPHPQLRDAVLQICLAI